MKEPKIRFKEFEGEWEENTFSNITIVSKKKNKDNLLLKSYSISNEYGFIPQNEQFENGGIMATANKSMYYIVTPNTFAYNPARINVGSLGYYNGKDNVIISSLYEVFKTIEQINDIYLLYWFKTLLFKKQIELLQEGGVRLYFFYDKLLKCLINYPSLAEQQSIATFFTSLDAQIKAAGERVASLKRVKAASLQAMFPQEGETTPRLRFKDFSADWQKVPLGECLEISNERNLNNEFDINEVLSVSDEAGVMNQIKLLGRSYAGKSVANYKVLRTNQVVYTKSPLKAKPYGIVKVNNGETGIVSVLYAVYNTKEKVSPDYIHYYFEPTFRINNYLLPLINKGAKNTMNISDEASLQGNIVIPKTIDEQCKIVEYFQSLDRQIALQGQRLEKLKQIKAACLEKMFV